MTELTFPQPGDLPDAAYFAFATGRGRSGIISGLTLSPDGSFNEVTVSDGKAIIDRGEMTTVHPNIDPPDTVSDAVAVVEIESQTVGLDPNALNHIFLDANIDQDDSGVVIPNTTGSNPTPESVKIGEVDTTNNTVSEQWNLIVDDGTLSYPDSDAANTVLQSLPTGVTVIDRSNDIRITGGSIEADGFGADAAESIQDIVGGLVVGQNDADVSYDDSAEQLSIDVSTLTNEEVEDTVASVVSSGTNLSWSYDDANDTLTVSLTDSISVGTIESGSTDIIDELGIPIYSDSINAPQREGNLIRVDGSSSQIAGLYIHDGSSYVKAGKTEDTVRELAYSVHRRQSL